MIGIGAVLLLWATVPGDKGAIPPLGDVLVYFYTAFVQGTIVSDVGLSVRRVLTGIVVGTGIAVVVGTACILPVLRGVVAGPLEFARPIPPIAWIPLAIVLFGVGDTSAVALVSLAVFFPVVSAIILALDSIDRDVVLAARSLGARGFGLLSHVYLPAMAPTVLTGLRIGVGVGWFSVVAAEMVGSHRGLGYGIQIASLNLEMERFFVYLSLIGLCGFLMNYSLEALCRRTTRWHQAMPNVD